MSHPTLTDEQVRAGIDFCQRDFGDMTTQEILAQVPPGFYMVGNRWRFRLRAIDDTVLLDKERPHEPS